MIGTTCPVPSSTQLPCPPKAESRTSVKSKQSSILSSCRICLSSLFDPAALTCGHRFCEDCLDQYWQLREKPDFLICPLCRAHAYNVDFTEKETPQPEGEFRKNFCALQQISNPELNKSTFMCFKISMLIPILYYLVKWLRIPVLDLLSFLKYTFSDKM